MHEHLGNEHFGVSELASAMNMSRSNLLRKIKKASGLSASQFIRKIRLEEGMELLKIGELNVSEVSHQVGFGSPSYFIKCFREQYGYPPGEHNQDPEVHETFESESALESRGESQNKRKLLWSVLAGITIVIIVGLLFFDQPNAKTGDKLEKSIAVLPFKNESNDASNLYFVNGLMESALNNLQKIEDLRVISRTSVEQYRDTQKDIPEIAKELNVSYLVEGSGQRIENKVLLNIQLIEASSDTPVWSEQYSQEINDIFDLQNDVAKKIAVAVKAIVTPQELEQIEKKPTENLEAYDYYLQALDPYISRTDEGLKQAIVLFEKAIEEDSEFALAYANIAISYYLLEISQADKQYTEKINSYSDKALLYDSKSAESLTAKAFYYIQTKEYKLALPYLEKALEYNPNSSLAVQMLADFYFRLVPNTDNYLKYALKGFQLNIASDSVTQSYTCLQLSNALVSSGFIDEALQYINTSLEYHSDNYYAPGLKAFVLFAKDGNVERTQNLLLKEWEKDTTRLDYLQDIAKLYYIQEDYETAYTYFDRFVKARERSGLDIYAQEDIKIAEVYKKIGLEMEAENFYNKYSKFCEADNTPYKSVNLVWKYSYEGQINKAIEQLKLFSQLENHIYWFILLENDPLIKPLKSHQEFEGIMQKIKDKFWKNQRKLRTSLQEKDLL